MRLGFFRRAAYPGVSLRASSSDIAPYASGFAIDSEMMSVASPNVRSGPVMGSASRVLICEDGGDTHRGNILRVKPLRSRYRIGTRAFASRNRFTAQSCTIAIVHSGRLNRLRHSARTMHAMSLFMPSVLRICRLPRATGLCVAQFLGCASSVKPKPLDNAI